MASLLPDQSNTNGNHSNVFVRDSGFEGPGDDALLRAASADIEQWARDKPDVQFRVRRINDTHLMLGFLLENWLLTCTVYIMEEGVCARLAAIASCFSTLPADERTQLTLVTAAINTSLVRGCWSVGGQNSALVFTVPLLRRFTSQSSIEPLCHDALDLAFLSVVASVNDIDRFLPRAGSGAPGPANP